MSMHSRFQSKASRVGAALTLGTLLLGLANAPAVAQDTDRGMGVPRESTSDVLFQLPDGVALDRLLSQEPASERIIGGIAAHLGRWPSMVAVIFINKNSNGAVLCGGTLISRQWVLTAAHCLASTMAKEAGWEAVVSEGSNVVQPNGGHWLRVASAHMHPDYSGETHLNDIALLELADPARSPTQKLLGRPNLSEELKADRMATVIGFGATREKSRAAMRLRQVDVPVVTQQQCQAANSPNPINEAAFCAGYAQGGKDSCQGDSGGPLYLTDKAGEKIQAGVVSYGKGCARANAFGVYASVGHFEDWIKSLVSDAIFVEPTGAQSPVNDAPNNVTPAADLSPTPVEQAQVSVDVMQGHTLKVGSFVDVRVLSSVGGQLVVFNQNPDGRAYQLYPSKVFPAPLPTPDDALIAAGKTITIPSAAQKTQGYRFAVRPPFGVNHLYAIVVPKGQRVAELIQRNYSGSDIADLGSLLNELVDAEKSDRGIEATRVPPTAKGSGEFTYEIVQ